MNKLLMLYATREGQTEKIAQRLVEHLSSYNRTVTLMNVADYDDSSEDLENFETLVFGASVHIGEIEKEMAQFINSHVEIIKQKPRSFFLVSLSAATKDSERRKNSLVEIQQNLDKKLNVNFSDVEMIAGALRYTKYSWWKRMMMKRIAVKEGGSSDISKDHEYTDWMQVSDYAEHLAVSEYW